MKVTLLAFLLVTSAVSDVFAQETDAGVIPDQGVTYSLKFPKDSSVQEILAFYKKLTGYQVVTDNQVIGRMTMEVPGPVSREKAIELIEATLWAHGFPIIQMQPDTVQIIGLGRSARSEALPLLTAPEQIPTAERVCTYVFKLKYRNPADLARLLKSQYIPPVYELPYVLPDPASHSVVVTARTTVLREMIRLVDKLDVPESGPRAKQREVAATIEIPRPSKPLDARAMRSLEKLDISAYETALKLTIVPTFHTPVHIEVFIGKKNSELTVYRFSRAGGYGYGHVELVFRRKLDHKDLEPFELIQKDYDIWKDKSDEEPPGTNGDAWTLEIKEKDRYQKVTKHSSDIDTKARNLEAFYSMGQWIRDLGGILPYDPYDAPE